VDVEVIAMRDMSTRGFNKARAVYLFVCPTQRGCTQLTPPLENHQIKKGEDIFQPQLDPLTASWHALCFF